MNKGRNLKHNLYNISSLLSLDNISKLFKNEKLPVLNPYWIIWFFEAEGTFGVRGLRPYLTIGQRSDSIKTLYMIYLFIINLPDKFPITKNKNDIDMTYSLDKKDYFSQLSIRTIDFLHDYIIPFFEEIDFFQSRKKIDFYYFSVSVKLRKLGFFYTEKGKILAFDIQDCMNTKRYSTNKNSQLLLVSKENIESVINQKPIFDVKSGLRHEELSYKYSLLLNKRNKKVHVYAKNENNLWIELSNSPFLSYSKCNKELGLSQSTIQVYIDSNRIYSEKYLFTSSPILN